MMKKLFLAIVAVAAITFTSCGNKSNANAEAADSARVDTTALAPETKSTFNALRAQLLKALDEGNAEEVTTALANFEAAYKTLANSGELEDLKGYGMLVKDFVAGQADKIKSVAGGDATIANLVSGIEALPTSAEVTIEDARSAVSGRVVGLANESLQKGAAVEATAEAAAKALKNAPAAAKEAVKNTVSDAKNAAEAAAAEAANNAAKEAGKKMDNTTNEAKKKASDAIDNASNKVKGKLGL